MALHDQFAERGLVVIAVHDRSVKSIAEMDERIARARKSQWFGRDLPFLVALDGDGSTTATYGITTFPTSLLIDRDGNVVGRLDVGPSGPDGNEAAISKLLGVDGKRSSWQDRFALVYCLDREKSCATSTRRSSRNGPNSSLARSARPGTRGRRTVSLVLPWNGTIRPRYPADPSLRLLLREIAADSRGYVAPDDTFEFAEGLKALAVPGDWIIRDGTTVEARLEAFQRAVKKELGRSIRCERRRVRATWLSCPGDLHPGRSRRNTRGFTSPRITGTSTPRYGGGDGTLDELLSSLSIITGFRFINDATSSASVKVHWVQHDSSLERGRHAELLANLSRQTSLEFRRQERLGRRLVSHREVTRAVGAWPSRGDSTAAIRGISERAQEKRNVIVLDRVVDLGDHVDFGIKGTGSERPEVSAGGEAQAVDLGFQGGCRRVESADATVLPGDAVRELGPAVWLTRNLEDNREPRRRFSERNVEHVGRDRDHGAILSRWMPVILHCPAAAASISASGSLSSLRRSVGLGSLLSRSLRVVCVMRGKPGCSVNDWRRQR